VVIAKGSTTIGAFGSLAAAELAFYGLLGAAFWPDQVEIVLPDAVLPATLSPEAAPTAVWSSALFRTLIGVEISDNEIRHCEEVLQEGHTLVLVRAGNRYPEAMDILHRCGREDKAAF
jgi:hypothetical protein